MCGRLVRSFKHIWTFLGRLYSETVASKIPNVFVLSCDGRGLVMVWCSLQLIGTWYGQECSAKTNTMKQSKKSWQYKKSIMWSFLEETINNRAWHYFGGIQTTSEVKNQLGKITIERDRTNSKHGAQNHSTACFLTPHVHSNAIKGFVLQG
jgi:hypothetical protein